MVRVTDEELKAWGYVEATLKEIVRRCEEPGLAATAERGFQVLGQVNALACQALSRLEAVRRAKDREALHVWGASL
jgi:hypothetical protein